MGFIIILLILLTLLVTSKSLIIVNQAYDFSIDEARIVVDRKLSHSNIHCSSLCAMNSACRASTLHFANGVGHCNLLASSEYRHFQSEETTMLTIPVGKDKPVAQSKICYGAKGNTYGSFVFNGRTNDYKLKLYHISGGVTCSGAVPMTPFSCLYPGFKRIMIQLSDSANTLLSTFSPADTRGLYANVIVSNNVVYLEEGREYRIWYEEDRTKWLYGDNSGHACALAVGSEYP